MTNEYKVYSCNEEDFSDFDYLADDLFSVEGVKIGDIKDAWEGDRRAVVASDFIPDIVEIISERAYEYAGEHAESWPDCEASNLSDLLDSIKKTVDEWASNNNMHPTFFLVENVKKIQVEITSMDGGYKILGD